VLARRRVLYRQVLQSYDIPALTASIAAYNTKLAPYIYTRDTTLLQKLIDEGNNSGFTGLCKQVI
jgi:hypothetical protein